MRSLRNQGQEFVKRHESLPQGEVIALIRVIIVEMDTKDA